MAVSLVVWDGMPLIIAEDLLPYKVGSQQAVSVLF
jgi:hypothetical protein